MPGGGMRKLLLLGRGGGSGGGFSRGSSSSSLSSAASSSSASSSSSSSSSSKELTYGSALMMRRMAEVESIITGWDADGEDEELGSLFGGSRDDSRRLFHAVADLGHFMKYLKTANVDGASPPPLTTAEGDLLRARRLMDVAIKRLLKEFFGILSLSRDRFGADDSASASTVGVSDSDDDQSSHKSSSDDDDFHFNDAALVDLRSIANCMISAGYAKECVKIYTSIRKSIVDERMHRLGYHRLTQSQMDKLDAAVVEHWIKSWLAGARVAVKTLFAGERRLCDFVFGSSENISKSCFAEITANAAVHFLEFPELVASSFTSKKTKRKLKSQSPEMIYCLLDLHNCVTDLFPEIEKIFSYNTTFAVQSQAGHSLSKLAASVRHLLADFEYSIQKDGAAVKEPTIPGGGLHPLTRRVMGFLVILSEYLLALDDIYFDQPIPAVDLSCSSVPPSVSARFAWLVLVLLAKLDAKAELYRDSSLSYVFLANNLRHIVQNVAASTNLRLVLGDVWLEKLEEKANSFARGCESMETTKTADDTDLV